MKDLSGQSIFVLLKQETSRANKLALAADHRSRGHLAPGPGQGLHDLCRMTLSRDGFELLEVTTSSEEAAARVVAAFVSRHDLSEGSVRKVGVPPQGPGSEES